jgi:hypothetical protein
VEPEGGAGGSETGGATASGGTPTSTGGTSSTGGTPAATGGTVSTGGTSSTGGAPTPPARVTLWSADVNVTIVPNGTKFVWPTVRIESKNPTFAGCPATSVAWPYAANVGDSEGAIELTTDEGFAKFVQCAQRVTAPAATVLRVLAGCASTSDPSSCTDRRANDVADPVAALAGARELSVTRTVTTFGSNGDRLAVHFEITGLR